VDENIYNPAFVKGLFNRMSGSYERVNFITSFGFSIRWRRQLLNLFQANKDNIEVIDLMTGMGETWYAVKRKFPNARLSALDFSSEMLKNAKKKNKQHFGNKINLLQQDVLENDLPSNHYDVVVCAFGLKTLGSEQLQTLAKEVRRILKEGGQFSFIEVSKPEINLLKSLYGFYLRQIIPILGRILLGNPQEYKMLWRYTDEFENARSASVIFNLNGLKTTYHSYFYGCATGFSGQK
jgi:demethylmenaquinone methyltransferase/2-methoxy-6-polyprenyl-1,4-benzoquinol methylase